MCGFYLWCVSQKCLAIPGGHAIDRIRKFRDRNDTDFLYHHDNHRGAWGLHAAEWRKVLYFCLSITRLNEQVRAAGIDYGLA